MRRPGGASHRPGWDQFSRPPFRLQVAGVSDRTPPLDLISRVQLREQKLVQALPNARLLPGAQPTPRGHPAVESELLRQMLPADPGVQHKQDSLQREPIIERLATRIAKMTRLVRQQRLDSLPQRIFATAELVPSFG